MTAERQKYYSRQNLHFLLYNIFDVLSLTQHEYFSAHDPGNNQYGIRTAEGIAEKTMRPVLLGG